MTVSLYVLGIALVLIGLVGLLLPVLPGAPLMFAGFVLVSWADGFTRIGWIELILLGVVTLVISVVDYVSSITGARRFGASRWGIAGSFVGLAVGLPFGIPGWILGPLIGSVLFEYVKDPDFKKAARIGLGSFVGFLIGTAAKYALAMFMLAAAVFFYLL
ncbi:hypothetical protein ABI59_21420 [Acidobacteria bacterium Mor1]|nr:hypothetical protein ABI59_21420 [Acidobacteria bacterium Mor1]